VRRAVDSARIRRATLPLIALCLSALLPACSPERDCTARVYVLPHDHRVEQVEVVGDMTGWEPEILDEICPCVWHRAFDLDAGDYLYELRIDGRRVLDVFNGLTGWKDADEYSLLRVEDCSAPGWQVDAAEATANGALHAELTFLRASGGAELDPASVAATLRDGTALTAVAERAGRVTVDGSGLPAGKHTVRVDAADRDGAPAERLVLPLWVEQAPFSWEGALVYQVVVDRFAGVDGPLDAPPAPGHRAGGDLAGLLRAMQDGYFDRLGVSALWISPMVTNAQGAWPGSGHEYEAYHGYWPVETRSVEPAFGTEDELDALVTEAHARGIRMLLDVVPNHFHTDHPLYAEHVDDWFNGDGSDCVCGTAECPWGEAIETCWFTPYLADLDWTNPEVVRQQTDDIAWWVERFDLDGLRIDAVPMMPLSATREIVHELARRFERGPVGLHLMGETFSGPGGWGSIARYIGPDGLDGQFDFPIMWAAREALGHGDGSMVDLEETVATSEHAWGGSGAVMSPMVGNHDVWRFITDAAGHSGDAWTDPPPRPDDDAPYRRLVLAQALVLTLPGAPVIYQGDEFGLPGAGDPDNRRVMRFDEQLDAREAWALEQVATLGRTRSCLPSLRHGERAPVEADDDVLAYLRDADDGRPALVVLNRSEQTLTRSFPLPNQAFPSGTELVDVLGGATTTVDYGATGSIELAPLSAQLLVPVGACP
jgi:glycosidase